MKTADFPSENYTAIELLRELARCRERALQLAIALRKKPEVKGVTTTFDIRQYGKAGEPVIELFVDAELENGTAMA